MATDSEPTRAARAAAGGGPAFRRRDLGLLVVLLALAGALAAVLIHGPAKATVLGSSVSSAPSRYAGLPLGRPKPAPALTLRNYLGTQVSLTQYRGRAVLVTFLYTHCPDVCPLITSKLHTALVDMPAAERREVAIVAVSVDPRGDTPATVAAFLRAHEMTGRMQYLLGSASALATVWQRWGIGTKRDTGNPEVVAHSALVYGITAHGKIVTVYPSNFSPSEIVHDVPRLADA